MEHTNSNLCYLHSKKIVGSACGEDYCLGCVGEYFNDLEKSPKAPIRTEEPYVGADQHMHYRKIK